MNFGNGWLLLLRGVVRLRNFGVNNDRRITFLEVLAFVADYAGDITRAEASGKGYKAHCDNNQTFHFLCGFIKFQCKNTTIF